MYQTAQERPSCDCGHHPPFDSATPEQAKEIDAVNGGSRRLRTNSAYRWRTSMRLSATPTSSQTERTSDGIHPDIGGYRKMAVDLIAALDPIDKVWR